MFIKIIKWSKNPLLKKENTPTEIFHVDSYRLSGETKEEEIVEAETNGELKLKRFGNKKYPNSEYMALKMTLMGGREKKIYLPKKEVFDLADSLSRKDKEEILDEEYYETKSITVYVTNDEGKTIQSYNL